MIAGIVHHLHLARQRDALRIGDPVLGELVDEYVAFEQKRGDTKRQVELRRGQPLRLIRPADMVDRDVRAVHDDLVDIVGPNGCRSGYRAIASSVVWLLPTQE